jgi:hypothetical protein
MPRHGPWRGMAQYKRRRLMLYHFSDRGDITEFRPRPPTRHLESEPLVYGIDAWHSPLYFFPRDCPRIGIWPLDSSLPEEVESFRSQATGRMRLIIDRSFEEKWRTGRIYRYEFHDLHRFIDCHDHGVWVSRDSVACGPPLLLDDLAACVAAEGITMEVVDSLAALAGELYDYVAECSRTSLHVSSIRMSLLPDWRHRPGRAVVPGR